MSETIDISPLEAELNRLKQFSADTQETLARALDEQKASFALQQEDLLARLQSLREGYQKNVVDLQAQADEQRRLLASQIHRLTSQHNSGVPINRLPPEILSSKIFSTLKALLGPGKRAWLILTHVCRRWRDDTLSDATLWTEISGSKLSAEWVETALKRSGTSPLSVSIEMLWQAEALTLVLKHADRFQRLRIHRRNSASMDAIMTWLNRPAPLLEELDLFASDICTAPHMLFAGEAPKLRSLALAGSCLVTPQSPFLRCITRLTLRANINRYTPRQLDDMSSSTPALEHLSLSNVLLDHTVARTPVFLEKLVSLTLVDAPQNCAAFFRAFKVSPSCRMTVRPSISSWETFTDADFRKVPVLIAANHHAYTFLSASINESGNTAIGERSVTVAAGTHDLQYPAQISADSQSLSLILTGGQGSILSDPPTRTMVAALQLIPSHSLDTLAIDLDNNSIVVTTADDCFHIFKPMYHLRTLRFSAPELHNLLNALQKNPQEDGSSAEAPCLPRLRHMDLVVAPVIEETRAISFAVLSLFESLRKRNSAWPSVDRLERLVLGPGLLKPYALRQLRKTVPYVEINDQLCFR